MIGRLLISLRLMLAFPVVLSLGIVWVPALPLWILTGFDLLSFFFQILGWCLDGEWRDY